MAQPFNFHGQGFSLRGDKGRFVLPPSFRKTLKEASGGELKLCLTEHDRWPCLTAFGTSRLDEFEEQLDREEAAAVARGQEFDRDLRGSRLFGCLQAPFDESGRFVCPDHLASMAGLEGAAFFNGNGRFFTIWSPERLAVAGREFEHMQRGCEALAGEAGQGKGRRK